MKRRLWPLPLLLLLVFQFSNCAKKGNPSGGPRDTIAPVIVRSVPENYSVLFEGGEVRVTFDEYIKLKDLGKNLIISPPLKYDPVIGPVSTSKQLRIKLLDTLQPNTSYSLNFGTSIVDNNEENPFNYYKYVFSTGEYLDSLTVNGRVNDALLPVAEFPVTVMLYKVDTTFSDSLVFKQKPTYITTTRDSSNTFELANVKEGRYLLLALKEENPDFTYQPATDKIGFVGNTIELPTDSLYTLTIFKQEIPYEVGRASHIAKNRISVGYRGNVDGIGIESLDAVPDGFESRLVRDREKDSVYWFFKPAIEADSLRLLVSKGGISDSLLVRMRNLYPDSLMVSEYKTGTLLPTDTVQIRANIPIVKLDESKVAVIDRDSLAIPTRLQLDTIYNLIDIQFALKEEQLYRVRLLPGALTDFFEQTNDTLDYTIRTKAGSDYGTLDFAIDNRPDYPLLVQLLNEKFEIVKEKTLKSPTNLFFDYINPGRYYVRIIHDKNRNGRWDSGEFVPRRKPEEVSYYPKQLEVRANWSLNERFKLN
jgi:uncharacterized protein (DUF2141 family)